MSIENEAVAIRKECISSLVEDVRSYLDNSDEEVPYSDYASKHGLSNVNYISDGLGGWSNAIRLARGEITADDIIESDRLDVKEILPILLEAAGEGYTSSVGYQEWRALKAEEGRKDIPSKMTIYHILGTWKNVDKILIAAGLKVKAGKKDLISKLSEAIAINGDKPYTIQSHVAIHESEKVKGLPPYHMYIQHFGSWNEAVTQAGGQAGSRRSGAVSQDRAALKENILRIMKAFVRDMKAQGKEEITRGDYAEWYQNNSENAYVHSYIYSNYEGGWAQAVLDAGGKLPENFSFRKRNMQFDDKSKLMKHVRRAARGGYTTYRGYDEWRRERIEKGEEGIPSASTIRVKMRGWTSVLDELRSEGFDIS